MVANVPKKKKQKQGIQKSSSDRTSTEKTSSGKTSTEVSSSDKTKTSSDQSKRIKTSSGARLPQNYLARLEKIEEQRERELRVIHQRADSHEDQDDHPTPIASMDSMEKQYEKLLIVEKVPTDQTKDRGKARRLSVVTQEEFAELAAVVHYLQEQYIPTGNATFPDNAELLDELRKGASLTDAMAALQLSARLEAAEKTLEQMITLVTDLVSKTPAIKDQTATNMKPIPEQGKEVKTEVVFGGDEIASRTSRVSRASTVSKKINIPTKSKKSLVGSIATATPSKIENDQIGKSKEKADCVTAEELDNVMQELYDEFVKIVTENTATSTTNAKNALKIANRLEMKLDESLNLGDRMKDLERLVSDYAEHINAVDTSISAQMTNYQEQLTQMQHDLESGIETMQEALANTGGDTAAFAELNNNFTNLQMDFEFATMRQRDLRDLQDTMGLDLQSLWKQIELLRGEKSDRDEVADALRDKAGIAALNGLVSRPEFDAVRGDLEKRIGAAYDKFNNQEIVWQYSIKIKAMMDIVGEPRAAAVSRKLHRDAACLSCTTPAHMDIEEHKVGPSFPAIRPPTMGETKSKPCQDGDHEGVCYPGFSIPHSPDPRSYFCHRYCGGSHTRLNNTKSRVPPGVIINALSKTNDSTVGTDGKTYMADHVLKPCKACNMPKKLPVPQEAEPAPETHKDPVSSDMTPPDYRMSGLAGSLMDPMGAQIDAMSATPPPPIDNHY
ncbi:unnamed protein product [Diatraea saccharalis]|uniref:DUF4795 domain-containing protein n=1 Tax=Diatraea saccharalis TaxID=40085 RepID=A0A9N9QWY0_9NEOP|nr:unnamed protein product [Diatraea saccharalis]